jgi:hypothetical protein
MPLAVGYLNNFDNFIKNAVSNKIFNHKLMVLTLFLSAKNTLSHIVYLKMFRQKSYTIFFIFYFDAYCTKECAASSQSGSEL